MALQAAAAPVLRSWAATQASAKMPAQAVSHESVALAQAARPWVELAEWTATGFPSELLSGAFRLPDPPSWPVRTRKRLFAWSHHGRQVHE